MRTAKIGPDLRLSLVATSSNLEQLLLFWAIFEQNYDRLGAHIKHEKVNDFTENFKLCEVREC